MFQWGIYEIILSLNRIAWVLGTSQTHFLYPCSNCLGELEGQFLIFLKLRIGVPQSNCSSTYISSITFLLLLGPYQIKIGKYHMFCANFLSMDPFFQSSIFHFKTKHLKREGKKEKKRKRPSQFAPSGFKLDQSQVERSSRFTNEVGMAKSWLIQLMGWRGVGCFFSLSMATRKNRGGVRKFRASRQ